MISLALALALQAVPIRLATTDTITWEVADRFRLFGHDQPAEVRTAMAAIASSNLTAQYGSIAPLVAKVFRNFPKSGYPFAHEVITADKRRTRPYAKAYISPESYQVTAKAPSSWTGDCEWHTDADASTSVVRQSCAEPILLTVNALVGGGAVSRVAVTNSAGIRNEETITIKDRLFVGLGDSFGSGEGNPDIPAKILDKQTLHTNDPLSWLSDPALIADKAEWLDAACSRSLFSQHVLSSFAYASHHPHEAVTLVEFSCSGAATYDGVLIPQKSFPRRSHEGEAQSQLQQLATLLCEGEEPDSTLPIRPKGYFRNRSHRDYNTALRSCSGARRTIDAVLLSVGGNDVGFGGVVKWVLFPGRGRNPFSQVGIAIVNSQWVGTVCPAPGFGYEDLRCIGKPFAHDLIKQDLPYNYASINEALKFLGGDQIKVFQTAYPDPTRNEEGGANCKFSDAYSAYTYKYFFKIKMWPEDVLAGMESQLAVLPGPLRYHFQLYPTNRQLELVRSDVLAPLDNQMETNARDFRWHFVNSYEPLLKTHGWCAKASDTEFEEMEFPLWSQKNQTWDRLPSSINPYAKRARWFRTPNDSVITSYDGGKSGVQGSVHPTAELHALIGDAVDEALLREIP